jgi:hypothetical protein
MTGGNRRIDNGTHDEQEDKPVDERSALSLDVGQDRRRSLHQPFRERPPQPCRRTLAERASNALSLLL